MRGFIDSELEKMKNAGSEVREKLREEGKEFYLDNTFGGFLNLTGLREHLAEAESQFELADRIKKEISVYEKLRNEFSKLFLDRGDYEVFDRAGNEPVILNAGDHTEKTAEIVKAVNGGSVCVILPTVRETSAFYRKLRRLLPDCTAVTDMDSKITSRVVCMPVALTKGMEFDTVILPHFNETEKNRRVAYMMTTRALHELYLIKS